MSDIILAALMLAVGFAPIAYQASRIANSLVGIERSLEQLVQTRRAA